MSTRVEPSSSSRTRAAVSTWPGCGRSACTSSRNAPLRPANASSVIAAARSAVSSKRSSASSASTPVASICAVPLLSARPSLNDSRIGSRPARLQRLGAGQALALVERLATAQQHDGQVRQRRQVAAGADRALLRHHRHDARVEHRGQRLQRAHADTRMTAHQRVDADHQHRAHHVLGERLAHAHGVGDDQVVLQFLQQRAFGLVPGLPPGSSSRRRCAPSSLSALLPKPVVTP